MVIKTLKRMAVASAFTGALGFAALGLGSGAASAEPNLPVNPDNFSEDWQTYIPMVTENIPVVTDAIADPKSVSPLDLLGLLPPGVI